MRRKMSQRWREMYKEVRQSDDQRILRVERRRRMDVIARSGALSATPRNDKINQRRTANKTSASLKKNKA